MTVNPFFQKNSILASIQKTLYWKQTPLSIFLCVQDKKIETSHFSFFPLEYPQQKRKSPVKSLPPLVVLCTLDWAFCLLYFLTRGKKLFASSSKWLFLNTSRNNSISFLSWGLSFSQLDKVSYTYRKIGLYATRQNQRHNNND